jgi:hypothetical protein
LAEREQRRGHSVSHGYGVAVLTDLVDPWGDQYELNCYEYD